MMVMKKILVLLAALPLVSGCYCSSGRKGSSAFSDSDVKILPAVSVGEDGFYRDVPKGNVIDFPEVSYSRMGKDWVFWLQPEKGHAKPPINGYFTKVVERDFIGDDGDFEKEWRRYELVVTDVFTTDNPVGTLFPDGKGKTLARSASGGALVFEVHAREGGSWLLDPEDYQSE